MSLAEVEVTFKMPVGDVPEADLREAEIRAQEAFVMELLRQGHISAGRAGELLEVDRWRLADIMSAYGVSPFDEAATLEDLKRDAATAAGALPTR